MYTLRKITPNDIDALVEYANNPKVHLYTSDKFPYPYLKEHGEAFIEFSTRNLMADILVIDVDGVPIAIGILVAAAFTLKKIYNVKTQSWGIG